MRIGLEELLASRPVLLADGATGTNHFAVGLEAGYPPELWNAEHPERVQDLHRRFIDAGADIILTNTFGANRQRLGLHGASDRVAELARRAAELAGEVAADADRPVAVAGSVGPTGELFEPLGALAHDDAVASFREEIAALAEGGADVAWIETMSAVEEVRAAAQAAVHVGIPYVVTCSFDTAGRTMMGLRPSDLTNVVDGVAVAPLAIGANCGVGASDLLVSLLDMDGAPHPIVAKGNCGVPRFEGVEVVYSGTPELMGRYAVLAADAGARIVGGCCGTTPEHLAAMRRALDKWVPGRRPAVDDIVAATGPLTNVSPTAIPTGRSRRRSR